MDKFTYHTSIPIGSLVNRSIAEEDMYFSRVLDLPANLISLVLSPQTGAFIRGLAKTYDVAEDKLSLIAFAVLRIAFGEKLLAQLASVLSTELQLPNDKAQRIAQEIEKELFAPVMLELNQYLAQQKQQLPQTMQPPVAQAGGARNVLDLKSQPRPPVPPPIPKR